MTALRVEDVQDKSMRRYRDALGDYDLVDLISFLPTLVLIYATKGQGKTVLLRCMLGMLQRLADEAGTPQRAVSNVYMRSLLARGPVGITRVLICENEKHKKEVDHLEDCWAGRLLEACDEDLAYYMRRDEEWTYKKFYGIDELSAIANSWNAMQAVTGSTVMWLEQIRKVQSDLYATTQFFHRINMPVLERFDSFWFVKGRKYLRENADAIPIDVYKLEGKNSVQLVRGGEAVLPMKRFWMTGVRGVLDDFDTFQRIMPMAEREEIALRKFYSVPSRYQYFLPEERRR